MKKLKLSRKAFICITLCLIVAVTSGVVFASAGANKPADTSKKEQNVNTSDASSEAVNTSEPKTSDTITVPETVKPAEAVKEIATPVSSSTEPTGTVADSPTKGEPYAHIPFTNKTVTPGDPESYIGTVGQCPFYEMAGDKGCYPPSDIKCNADWSQCEYVGTKWEGSNDK